MKRTPENRAESGSARATGHRGPGRCARGDRFVVRDETSSRTSRLAASSSNPNSAAAFRKPIEPIAPISACSKDSSGTDALEALINLQESFAARHDRVLATLMNIPFSEADTALCEAPRFVKLYSSATKTSRRGQDFGRAETLHARRAQKHHKTSPLLARPRDRTLRTRLPYEIGARASVRLSIVSVTNQRNRARDMCSGLKAIASNWAATPTLRRENRRLP